MIHRPVLLSLFAVTAAVAAEPEPFLMGEVLVEADREAHRGGLLAGHMDAATVRLLERYDLAEALRAIPGVTMSNNGPRNEAGVSVRGFDLRQVPLFLDGIPVYVPYDGYVDLRRFATGDVSEIHVNKGFSSSLFGANTMGGAINIVTRRPQEKLEGDFSTGWFEEDGFQSAFNLGTNQGQWYAQFSGSFLTQDSWPLSQDFVPGLRENGGSRDNAYREDWRASAKFGWTPNETDEYVLGYASQHGEKGNPVYTGNDPLNTARFWQWPYWDKQTVYVLTKTKIGDRTELRSRLFWDQFQNALFSYDNATYTTQNLPRAFQSYYDDWTAGANVEISTKLSEANTLEAAVHSKLDHHWEQNKGAAAYEFEDITWSLGVEDTHRFNDRLSMVTGVSYDYRDIREAQDTNTGAPLDGDSFDSVNPQIGLFYDISEDHHVFTSIAKKSRFPTIKDRYSYRLGQAIPNPDLQPESAVHLEFGYRGDPFEHFTVHASIFAANVDDTIQRVDNAQPGRFQLQNTGESRNQGFETGVDWKPNESVQISAGYTRLVRENESHPLIRLTDSPEHRLFAYAELRPVEWLSIIPSVEYNSDRYSTTYGVKAKSFAVTNLKLAFHLPHEITLNAGVNNIFDRNYALTEGFPEPGRNYFVSMQYQF